jgi:hypothetical protein
MYFLFKAKYLTTLCISATSQEPRDPPAEAIQNFRRWSGRALDRVFEAVSRLKNMCLKSLSIGRKKDSKQISSAAEDNLRLGRFD